MESLSSVSGPEPGENQSNRITTIMKKYVRIILNKNLQAQSKAEAKQTQSLNTKQTKQIKKTKVHMGKVGNVGT
jgi:hypothetical protein